MRTTSRVRATIGSVVFLLLAAPAAAAQPAGKAITWEPHVYEHAGGKEAAERAMLAVPERHDRPNGRTIQLALVRLKSRAAQPGPPILYLAGGPGSSGIEAGRGPRFALFDALREIGDVVTFDQRGAGHSRPNLNCGERWGFDPAQPRSWQSLAVLAVTRVESCAARLRADGVDLAAYNTRESANDVAAIRRALGVPAVTLLGISYGTHLGLAVMKQHPAAVHRAVLAGVVGPDHVLKLPSNIDRIVERFGQEVESDPAFGAMGSFSGALKTLLAGLAEKPVQVTIDRGGTPMTVSISAFDVRVLLSLALEDRETMRNVPLLVNAMARGEFRQVATQLAGLASQPIPTAMNLVVECASGATAARWSRIQKEEATALIGRAIDIPQPEICPALGSEDLGDAFRAPIKSSTPTLLISGELDLRTPPSNAEEVRAGGLTKASHLLLTRAGHDDDLLVSSAELQKTIVEFVSGKDVRDRRIELPRIPFTRPPQE